MGVDRYNFVTPVWGGTHIQAFLEIGLPSLLASSNIPGMASRKESRYQIFTRESDLRIMEKSAAFNYLRDVISVDVEILEEVILDPRGMMSDCHRDGLRRAHELQAAAVFVPPECIWSDGSMMSVEDITARGFDIIHISGVRLDLEAVTKEVDKEYRSDDSPSLQIAPRDLVKLGIHHLHPIAALSFFCERGEVLLPANLFWSVGDHGIIARCFHLHPLLVVPNERSLSFQATIDDDLALVSAAAGAREYVVTDSDEILTFELSPLSYAISPGYHKNSIEQVAAFAEGGANKNHLELIKSTIRLHSKDIDPSEWAAVENDAEKVVQGAFNLLGQSSWELLFNAPIILISRLKAGDLRQERYLQSLKNSMSADNSQSKSFASPPEPRKLYEQFLYFCIFTLPPVITKLLIGHPPKVTFWHLRWSYYRDIATPIIDFMSELEGKVLYIEVGGVRLCDIIPLDTSSRTIKIVSRENLLDDLRQSANAQYDVVVLRNPLGEMLPSNVVDTISSILRDDGRLIVIGGLKKDERLAEFTSQAKPCDFKVMAEQNYYAAGAAIPNWFVDVLKKSANVRDIAGRSGIRGTVWLLLLFPIIISIGLITSCICVSLSILGRRIWHVEETITSMIKGGTKKS